MFGSRCFACESKASRTGVALSRRVREAIVSRIGQLDRTASLRGLYTVSIDREYNPKPRTVGPSQALRAARRLPIVGGIRRSGRRPDSGGRAYSAIEGQEVS